MENNLNSLSVVLAILALVIAIVSCNQRSQVATLEKEKLRLSIELKKLELAEQSEAADTNIIDWFQHMDSVIINN